MTLAQLPAWLQALAALASLGFAYAMFRITKEYVIATKQIAVSTAAQVELMRAASSPDAARKEALIELQQHLAAVREFLGTIPDPTDRSSADHRARITVPVNDSTLDGVLSAARKIGAATAETATRLVQATRWLRERILAVQAVNPALGFNWERFDWDGWGSRYLEASHAFTGLVNERAA